MNETPPSKIFFWTKNCTKSEGQDVVNTIVCTVGHWRQEANSMETNNMNSKLEYFLDNGNVPNIFEIQTE